MAFWGVSARIAFALTLLACAAALLALCGRAGAQDLEAGLAGAESRATAAAVEASELEAAVEPVKEQSDASAARAAPAVAASQAADERVASIEGDLAAERRAAAREVAAIEAERRQAADDHDSTVWTGIGIGLAALVLAAVALGWERIRTSRLAARVLAPSSPAGDGGAEPRTGLPPVPPSARRTAAAALAAISLAGFGAAALAGEADSREVSPRLRREASETDPSTPALVRAERRAARLDRRASPLLAAAGADQRDLRTARRRLVRAEARLARATGDVATFTRRLAALTRREEHAAEEEARRAEEQAAEEARASEEQRAEECDPNYSGCLDPHAVDYDCLGGSGDGPLYTGEVRVLGVDHYGLDSDGDGIGCESS